ncbi:aspartate aminotransferase family protein [Spirochaeta africana]|uniref:2,4-diaminobutyrate 4-transaminase n=1 Tax=Spirochaeta africana (strain ATCC 700263 / DSM 8902 / Z-7692) TaxID=889378 RepID=H9UFJ5_SPIAZ|nr:aspartate aminotransferase family protein [Spirochaeta africana]AFG36288.1 2,4-diaminobutyrate 4-transaminase [Spirochaeta africana DSM 8902]
MQIFEQHESGIRGYCRTYPTVFSTASNARQTDENGKSYIDFFAGAGVLNFGHNNPAMKKAVIEYLENDGVLHSLDMYTTAKRSFISSFVDTILTPRSMDYKLQFMGPTGSNAVEAALKLARKVTGRQDVVAFSHGFHGMTLGSLACTANSYFRDAAGVPLPHVIRAPFGCEPVCQGCTQGCGLDSLHQLRAQFEEPSSGLPRPAAFILEAIQAEGGVHVASAAWLREVQQLAHDLGALFIIDDIQAGCGRTGNYFSFDGMGLSPDIITLAKGIGGIGTPLAMNLVKPEHDAHWEPGEHTGTFRGQDISFIAGTEALRYFEDDNLMKLTRANGILMRDALQSVADRFPKRGLQVRGKGMMQALDLGDGSLAKQITADCFAAGLLVGPCGSGGRVIKLIPPLTIPDEDLAQGLAIFTDAAISRLEAA